MGCLESNQTNKNWNWEKRQNQWANSVEPDEKAHIIWIYTVCPDVFRCVVLKGLSVAGPRLGGRNPPPVLTSDFNRLKLSRSICQKVVNTGQYESEWSIENSKRPFCGVLRYLYRFYVLFKKNKNIKKNIVLSLPRALFMVRFPSQDLSAEFCITVHAPNTSISCII